jgi:hypothetical protein
MATRVETYKELKKQAVEKARKTLACKKIEFSSIHTPEQIAKLGSSFKILYASLYAVLKKYIETKLIEGNRLSCYDACMHLMQTELSRHGFNKAMIQYVVCGRPLLKNSM